MKYRLDDREERAIKRLIGKTIVSFEILRSDHEPDSVILQVEVVEDVVEYATENLRVAITFGASVAADVVVIPPETGR